MTKFQSTKVIELGSCAFRQPWANSHCKFIHGYRLVAKFWFGCNELDKNNWVVDFGGLKGLKQKLEHQFDHTLCVAADDPALPTFKTLSEQQVVDLRIMPNGTGIERIAEWCGQTADVFIRAMTNERCWVEKVEVWEHEKNSSIYTVKTSNCCNPPNEKSVPSTIETVTEPVTESKKPETISTPPLVQPQKKSGHIPAPVGNTISKGLGNPFGGTSWSADNGDSMR